MKSFPKKMMAVLVSVALVVGLMPSVALADGGERLSAASLVTQASAMDEAEPNDDFDEATTITMNRWVYGSLEDGEGPDYYKVNLPGTGSVALTVTNGKHYGNGWNRFLVRVYNKYYQEVGSLESIDAYYTKPEHTTISLPKGACYLVVKHDSWWNSVSDNHPYHFKLTYNIPSTTVTKVTAAKKAFKVKWMKKSGALKYQLRYSASKNMSKAKTVNVSKKSSSKKIAKLKAKKKYWVQVRVAKKIGGQTYWSGWSSKKAVRTKK